MQQDGNLSHKCREQVGMLDRPEKSLQGREEILHTGFVTC